MIIWDKNGNQLLRFTGHDTYARCIIQLLHAEDVMSISDSGEIIKWSSVSHRLLTFTFRVLDSSFLLQLRDGRIVVPGSTEWITFDSDGNKLCSYDTHYGYPSCIIQLHDSRLLTSHAYRNSFCVLKLSTIDTFRELLHIATDGEYRMKVEQHHNGTIISVDIFGAVSIWSVDGQLLRKFTTAHYVVSVYFAMVGSLLTVLFVRMSAVYCCMYQLRRRVIFVVYRHRNPALSWQHPGDGSTGVCLHSGHSPRAVFVEIL